MKIKIVNEGNILVENKVTYLNIYEDGCVEFQGEEYFFTTTQGHSIEDIETTLWLDSHVHSDDLSCPIFVENFELSDIEIYLMLNDTWEKIPLKDSFKESLLIKKAVRDSVEWFDSILGFSSTEEAISYIYSDEGYTLGLYKDLKSSLQGLEEDRLQAIDDMAVWFEETGVEVNGYKTLEEALLRIFNDEGATLELYNRLKNISKKFIEPQYKEIENLISL